MFKLAQMKRVDSEKPEDLSPNLGSQEPPANIVQIKFRDDTELIVDQGNKQLVFFQQPDPILVDKIRNVKDKEKYTAKHPVAKRVKYMQSMAQQIKVNPAATEDPIGSSWDTPVMKANLQNMGSIMMTDSSFAQQKGAKSFASVSQSYEQSTFEKMAARKGRNKMSSGLQQSAGILPSIAQSPNLLGATAPKHSPDLLSFPKSSSKLKLTL